MADNPFSCAVNVMLASLSSGLTGPVMLPELETSSLLTKQMSPGSITSVMAAAFKALHLLLRVSGKQHMISRAHR